MSRRAEEAVARARWLILVGWIVPPVVWLASLQVAYALVPMACRTQRTWPLWLATAVGLALVVASGLFAWRRWRPARLPDDDPATRDGFLAAVGVLLSVECGLVLLAQALALSILHPCD